MTTTRPTQIAAAAATAGGLSWLTKVSVIAITDGSSSADGVTSVLYILAVVLLFAGGALVPLLALRPQRPLAVAGCFVLGPIVFIASYLALDALGVAVIGDAGPTWLNDEIGIVLTGIAWLAAGLTALRGGALRTVNA